MATRTMPVEEFEAHCLSLVDEVAATGDEIVITRAGRAVATLLCSRSTTIQPRLPTIRLLTPEQMIGSVHWVSEEEETAPTGEPLPGEGRPGDE